MGCLRAATPGGFLALGVLSLSLAVGSATAAPAGSAAASAEEGAALPSEPASQRRRPAVAAAPAAPLALWSNAALHRPCEPSPQCHRLLDGATAAAGGAASGAKEPRGRRQQRRAGAANGTGIEAGDVAPAADSHAFASGGGIDMGFMVFLRQRAYISKVVIFCVPASDGNNGDVSTGGPHRRTLIVTTWMGKTGGALEDAGGADRTASPAREGPRYAEHEQSVVVGDPGGGRQAFRVEFAVAGYGSAVSVRWGDGGLAAAAPGDRAGAPGTAAPGAPGRELQVTEVEVISTTQVACTDEPDALLSPIVSSLCPDEPDALLGCDAVRPGDMCEGSGECFTDDYLDNCGGYDVYIKSEAEEAGQLVGGDDREDGAEGPLGEDGRLHAVDDHDNLSWEDHALEPGLYIEAEGGARLDPRRAMATVLATRAAEEAGRRRRRGGFEEAAGEAEEAGRRRRRLAGGFEEEWEEEAAERVAAVPDGIASLAQIALPEAYGQDSSVWTAGPDHATTETVTSITTTYSLTGSTRRLQWTMTSTTTLSTTEGQEHAAAAAAAAARAAPEPAAWVPAAPRRPRAPRSAPAPHKPAPVATQVLGSMRAGDGAGAVGLAAVGPADAGLDPLPEVPGFLASNGVPAARDAVERSFVWQAAFVAAVAAVAVLLRPWKAAGLPQIAYDQLPDVDTEAPFAIGAAQGDWWDDGASGTDALPLAGGGLAAGGPRVFHIGSPRSSPAQSRSPPPEQRYHGGRRPRALPLSPSETEPEGEPSAASAASSRAGSPGRPGECGTGCSSGSLATTASAEGEESPGRSAGAVSPAEPTESEPQPKAQPATAAGRCRERRSTGAGGRVVLLHASPLVLRNPQRPGQMVEVDKLVVEREWDVMVQAYDLAAQGLRGGGAAPRGGPGRWQRPGVSLSAELLTSTSLQHNLVPVSGDASPRVLHLSAHGFQGDLLLEDGRGTAQIFSSGQLEGLLQLRNGGHGPEPEPEGAARRGGLRLVLLNACSLASVGKQLERSGVPHVIGTSVDLLDSDSHCFLRALYSYLFAGSTVCKAFQAARVALLNSAQVSGRSAAGHFFLLPEDGDHSEVLFHPQRPAAPSAAVAAPRPADCEDGGSSSGNAAEWDGCTTGGEESGFASSEGCSGGAGSRHEAAPEGDAGSGSDEACGSAGEEERRLLLPQSEDAAAGARAAVARSRSRAGPPRAAGAPWGPGPQALAPPCRWPGRRRAGVAPVSAAAPQGCVEPVQSPFGRAIPQSPEDFLGRTFDVWQVLQMLTGGRRAVVVHDHDKWHGNGKSTVLDAVHRAFVLNTGGVCVAVRLRMLGLAGGAEPCAGGGWIEKTRAAVRLALRECREQWWPAAGACDGPRPAATSQPAARRRRASRGSKTPGRRDAVSRGFHPLSEMGAEAREAALEELVGDMAALAELAEARCRHQPSGSSKILWIMDECDHLVQQPHFQDSVARILGRCGAYSLLLSTRQRMEGTAGGQFKVVHHPLKGLDSESAARLFMLRVHRALRWEELLPEGASGDVPGAPLPTAAVRAEVARAAAAATSAPFPGGHVVRNEANEQDVFRLVASHPVVAAQLGNPKRLIKLASRVDDSLPSLGDLLEVPLEDL